MTIGLQILFITKPTDCLLDRLINEFAVILFAVITCPTHSYYKRWSRGEKNPSPLREGM